MARALAAAVEPSVEENNTEGRKMGKEGIYALHEPKQLTDMKSA